MDITLFEVHLDDASFSSSAPFLGGSDEGRRGGDQESESESGASRLLVAFVGLALVAAVAWMVRNGKPESISMSEGELVEVEQ